MCIQCMPVSMVKYVCKTCQSIQYKDSFVKNYLIKQQLGKSVSDPIIALNLLCSRDTFLQDNFQSYEISRFSCISPAIFLCTTCLHFGEPLISASFNKIMKLFLLFHKKDYTPNRLLSKHFCLQPFFLKDLSLFTVCTKMHFQHTFWL